MDYLLERLLKMRVNSAADKGEDGVEGMEKWT